MKPCPYCSEQIQDEAIKCRFCGEWLSPRPEERVPPPGEGVSGAPLEQQLRQMLEAGRKMQAIKRLREADDTLDLAEAKMVIDGLEMGKSLAESLAALRYPAPNRPTPSGMGCSLLAVLLGACLIYGGTVAWP